jgi:hypothetical protein
VSRLPPDAKYHTWLEKNAADYLVSKDFYVGAAPYHAVCEEDMAERLQEIFTLDALYLRGRADRIAVHKTQPIAFELEVKSLWDKRSGSNFTVEALPLLRHRKNCELLDLGCLYICYHPRYECHFGFWACDLPPIAKVDIPRRQEYEPIKPQLMEWFSTFGAEIRIKKRWKGSGDPYIIIRRSDFVELPHWKILIDDLLEE